MVARMLLPARATVSAVPRRWLMLAAWLAAVSASPLAASDLSAFVARRCVETHLSGKAPDIGGLKKVSRGEASGWLEGYTCGTVHVGAGGTTTGPLLIVPCKAKGAICHATYRGQDRGAFKRDLDTFARRSDTQEVPGAGGWDGETEVRVFRTAARGREVMILAVNYPFLKSTTVFVLTPQDYRRMGNG